MKRGEEERERTKDKDAGGGARRWGGNNELSWTEEEGVTVMKCLDRQQ